MHLAIPFTLLIGSLVAAAPSIQHAQISVEVTHIDAQNQADALHSSEELVMNHARPGQKNLPFNFTLSVRHSTGGPHARLPLGFESLDVKDGFIRAELGFSTVFELRDGKLITDNRALGYHVARIFPPWISLWSLNREEPQTFLEIIAISKSLRGRQFHFLELESSDQIFGAYEVERGEPVFVGPSQEFHSNRLFLAVEPIQKSSDDINADSAEDLL